MFAMLGNAFRWIVQVVAFPVTRLRGMHTAGPVVRWTLHVLLLLVVLVALGAVNYLFDLEKIVRAPWGWARRIWLPLVFLNVYLLAWLGWWWWRLFRERQGPGEFPEIDEAWKEALAALDQAGIDLSSTPVYLVLGRPAGGEAAFMWASQMPLAVPQAPRRNDAPLHVFAAADAVFITCPGASLLGKQAELLAEVSEDDTPAGPASAAAPPWQSAAQTWPDTPRSGAAATATATAPGAAATSDATDWQTEETTAPAATAPATSSAVTTDVWTDAVTADQPVQPARVRHPSPLNDSVEVQRFGRQLQRVCHLLAHERRPYCPLNGIVALLPAAALQTEAEATETAVMLQRDLQCIQQATQLACPVTAIVCDLETLPGCTTLLARFPQQQRHRRLGVQFPCLPSTDPVERGRMIDQGVHWLAEELLPPLSYRLMHLESDAEPDAVAGNERLYELSCQLRAMREHLAHVLRQGVWNDQGASWLLSGCYLAATGRDAVREQGFVAGIIPHLQATQNHVRWLPQALADDRRQRLASRLGYVAVALFLLAIGWLVW